MEAMADGIENTNKWMVYKKDSVKSFHARLMLVANEECVIGPEKLYINVCIHHRNVNKNTIGPRHEIISLFP